MPTAKKTTLERESYGSFLDTTHHRDCPIVNKAMMNNLYVNMQKCRMIHN